MTKSSVGLVVLRKARVSKSKQTDGGPLKNLHIFDFRFNLDLLMLTQPKQDLELHLVPSNQCIWIQKTLHFYYFVDGQSEIRSLLTAHLDTNMGVAKSQDVFQVLGL